MHESYFGGLDVDDITGPDIRDQVLFTPEDGKLEGLLVPLDGCIVEPHLRLEVYKQVG